jgi:hypothetical protein
MAYLTENQITEIAEIALTEIAEAALVSFEITASWKSARTAAIEYAADEFGVTLTGSQLGYALNKAKVGWTAISYAAKKAAA